MIPNKFSPLAEGTIQRINLIHEGFMLCAAYANNSDISITLREIGRKSMAIYRLLLINEIEILQAILINEIDDMEAICHELGR